MKIPFGIYKNEIIHISEVNAPILDVFCPYCKQQLIAKKGRIKRHHFAHKDTSCTQHFSANFFDLTGRLPLQLPLSVYAQQKLTTINQYFSRLKTEQENFQGKEITEKQFFTQLKKIIAPFVATEHSIEVKELFQQIERYLSFKVAPFPEFHELRWVNYKGNYTDGKNHYSAVTIAQKNYEYCYPSILNDTVELLKNYHQKEYDNKEIDYKIELFQKDLSYFNRFNLYFLAIKVDHRPIFKIGLTARNIEKRMQEIERSLKKYYLNIEMKLIFLEKGLAFLEAFFKQKYAKQQVKIGSFTEYFDFTPSAIRLIIKDLNLAKGQPNRNAPNWIDWVYFNFNGKIYGHREKCVYVKDQKYLLTNEEFKDLNDLIKECYN